MKKLCKWMVVSLLFVSIMIAGLWAWAHRPAADGGNYPGFVWVASGDGTSMVSTSRVQSLLRSNGIACIYETMLVADYYVRPGQLAKARLVLLREKLINWDIIWSIH